MYSEKGISLGKPITSPVLIPVLHKATPNCINEPFMVDGEPYNVTCVSFKTPHGVVFVDEINNIDVSSIGQSLGTHPLFPIGASIVFVQVTSNESLKARLWQKGQGEIDFTPESVCVAATATRILQKTLKDEICVAMGSSNYQVICDRNAEEVFIKNK